MDPLEVKQEIDKNRESVHELRTQVQLMALAAQQTAQVVPQIFAKMESIKEMMHAHGKDTEILKGEIKAGGEKTSAALLLLGVKMDAADTATDFKIDEHLAAHRKWFPIIPTLIVAFVLAAAGAIFALIKKG